MYPRSNFKILAYRQFLVCIFEVMNFVIEMRKLTICLISLFLFKSWPLTYAGYLASIISDLTFVMEFWF
jgi:hypothetical protein